MELHNKSFRCGKLHFTLPDLCALFVFAVLAVVLLLRAPYGLTETDEPLYQVYEYRLLKGDRLFFDDWTLTPFSTIFNFVPFAVYYLIAGGTGGMLLSLRFFYVFLKLAVFAVVYLAIRANGFWAVLAALTVVGAEPFGLKTLNYYLVCSCALLFAGIVFFYMKAPKKRHFVLAGLAFSCAVLAEPSMAAVWFLFSMIVLMKRIAEKRTLSPAKQRRRILHPGSWSYSFIGIVAAALLLFLLCAVFFMHTAPGNLRHGFLNALNDPERSGGIVALLEGRLSILRIYVRIFHPALFFPFLALLPAAIVSRRYSKRVAYILLLILVMLYAALTLRLLFYPMREIGYAIGETVCHPLPLCLLAPVFYAYTEQRNRKLLAFLLFGFAVMLCGDMISMTAFGAFSEVCALPAILIIRDFYAECRSRWAAAAVQKTTKTSRSDAVRLSAGKKTAAVFFAFLFVFMPLTESAHIAYLFSLHETEYLFNSSDAPLDTVITDGIYRGIRTTAQIAGSYEKSVRDAKKISDMCKNRLYVADLAPTVYLDADVLIAAHSPYYYYQEGWNRVSLWWEMHPEKRPDVIYIPYEKLNFMSYPDESPAEKLLWLRSHADIQTTEGEIGCIVKILRWYTQNQS